MAHRDENIVDHLASIRTRGMIAARSMKYPTSCSMIIVQAELVTNRADEVMMLSGSHHKLMYCLQ